MSRSSSSQSNALVNVVNLQGNTALHEAVRGGHQALVELLLRGGASPGLRNKRQRTPLDCAYELGGKVVLLLIKHNQNNVSILYLFSLNVQEIFMYFHAGFCCFRVSAE